MNQENKELDKFSVRASRLRIIGLSFILLSFIAFIIFSTAQHNKILVKDGIIARKDSVLIEFKNSSLHFYTKRDSLVSIVKELFRLRNEHKADSIGILYADTLLCYFKYLKNVSKKDVTKNEKWYWRKFVNDRFYITEPVQIISNSSHSTAIVIGRQSRDGINFENERVEVQFNFNNKINSIRAFKLIEQ